MIDRTVLSLTAMLSLLALYGCGHVNPSFEPTRGPIRVRGASLAVIAGLDNGETTLFASCLSNSLKERSVFRVIPQHELARLLPPYPSDIRGPYRSAYFDIEYDFEGTDRARLREIGRMLGVEYLYVVWIPATYRSGRSRNILEAAQLFELPECREVGRSGMTIRVIGTDSRGPSDGDIRDQLKSEADKMAREIAEETATVRR